MRMQERSDFLMNKRAKVIRERLAVLRRADVVEDANAKLRAVHPDLVHPTTRSQEGLVVLRRPKRQVQERQRLVDGRAVALQLERIRAKVDDRDSILLGGNKK